ncbi:sensor histidine kinase [Salidesulfovibrio onnuriiensis]|uniref:sensor histidine kinase n=1 Tax=Salidesulfovibrio onnuriiensis TaxID=2583823 RepID=UPI0011C6F772|nr:HAMP domain-containing sensor histidine kinase [Salidesulfovibrio onnuriiensis]
MVRPNLRQTIILGIVIFTLAFGGIALLSLSNINRLQQEVVLVEHADDLRNLILEIRREEKNFFLYKDTAFFSQGRADLEKALTALDALSGELGQPLGREHGLKLQQGLSHYGALLTQIDEVFRQGKIAEDHAAARELRETGQRLVEHSRAIAEFERESILGINQKLRMTLIVSMGVIALVVFALVIFVSKSILGPLRQVQEATRQIAQGTFVPLPIRNAHDEIQQVFVALNSMVDELKKRQTQLVQAQKLSSIGTLASGIAHQLNNPLNNISTSAQILEEATAGKDEFSDKMMDNIIQETIRARDIVKGLLEFSRHQDFAPTPNKLQAVIQGAARLVSSQLGPRISLDVNVPDALTLSVDRQRLQEAFINLIINAIQAIGERKGSIRIQAAPEEGYALISVSDSGDGMSPETLQRIFDPFFSTKEVGQGTGLGLYIVYGIIEKHQGTIRVESSPGQGTTFYIRIPLMKEGLA